jgi:hypothetical protein
MMIDPAPGSRARLAALTLVGLALVAGGVLFARSLTRPQGTADNVAEAPAGGRTQADPRTTDTVDVLVPGIPEAPDVPPDEMHAGVGKVGARIRAAVMADGEIGDLEVPGLDLTGVAQAERKWVLDQAVAHICPCGCGQDYLECRRDDVSCPISPGFVDSLIQVARARG